MPTIRNISKLGSFIIAALTGCGEDGAFNPISEPAVTTPPVSSYREISFLNKSHHLADSDPNHCMSPSSSNSIKISPPKESVPSCIFVFDLLPIPSHTGTLRVRSGISSEEPKNDAIKFHANYFLSLTNGTQVTNIFKVVISNEQTKVDDFSFTIPSSIVLDGNTIINIAFEEFTNITKPLTVTRLSFEFDVPQPKLGSF